MQGDGPSTTDGKGKGKGNEPEPDANPAGTTEAEASGGLWGKRSVRLTASVAAALLATGLAAGLATGIGLGVTSALRGSVPADARIPLPPAKNAAFVESDDGAGQDQQNNILQSSASGVVSVRSARGAVLGSGFVITRSGFVLASYHGLPGAGALTARLAMSGKTYPARLVGSDAEANLALLQLSGGSGFRPVAIGTAADIQLNDRVASAGGTWTARALTLSAGSITGIGIPVTLDGQRLTGLLEVNSLAAPAIELGGPLFNLSGQVLGLSIGYGTRGGTGDGYVVPIDSALRIARQIAGQ